MAETDNDGQYYYTLSKDILNRQRIEIACYNRHSLEEVNSTTYPALSHFFDSYSGARRRRLNCILDYLSDTAQQSFNFAERQQPQKGYTDIPYAELVGRYGGSRTTYETIFNALAVWGMIEKRNPDRTWTNTDDKQNYFEHSTYHDENARSFAAEHGKRNSRTYYHIPRWTVDVLSIAEQIAQENPEAKQRTLTNLIDNYGTDAAQDAADTGRKIPNDTQRARAKIDQYIAQAINTKGYCTAVEVAKAIHLKRSKYNGTGRKTIDIKKVLRDYAHELADKYSLRYAMPTKAQRQAWSLKNNKWIFTLRNSPEGTEGTQY